MKEKPKHKLRILHRFFKWQLLLALFTLAVMLLIALFGPFRLYSPSSNVSLQIFYPLYFWEKRIVGFLLLTSVILLVLWTPQLIAWLRERRRQQDVPDSGQRLIVLLTAILLTFVVYLKFIHLPPFTTTFFHQDSVVLNGKMYHLATERDEFSIINVMHADGFYSGKHREYILYECDQFGWMCTNRVNEEIPWWEPEEFYMSLQVDTATTTIHILHDGEVIYTYPEER